MQDIGLHEYRELSKSIAKVVLANGKPVEHTIRIPVGSQSVVIDALNVVVDSETFDSNLKAKLQDSTDEKYKEKLAYDTACQIAITLGMIVGHEFEEVTYTGRGANFYKYAFRLGDINNPFGLICLGHAKSDTVLIMFYGEGCRWASEMWEGQLWGFLTHMAVNPKISRVDLALDDFDGLYSSAELSDKAETEGKFALTNRKPQVQQLGDWKRHEGRGRTLQVGSREGGKMYRGYEKGKQLGDKDSFWFRHEVELSNKNRLIPLDVLLDPTGYFVGCYPYCAELVVSAGRTMDINARKIEVIQKTAQITYQKAKEIVKHQFGKYLKVFRDFHSDTEILDMLVTDKKDYYPKRLSTVCKLKTDTPVIMQRHFDKQNQETILDLNYCGKLLQVYDVPF